MKGTLHKGLNIPPHKFSEQEANPKSLFPNKNPLSPILLPSLLFSDVIFKRRNVQRIPQHFSVLERRESY